MFDDATISKAVTDAMAVAKGIPADHQGAFITLVDRDEVKAVLAHKLDDHWVVTGYLDHPWSGGLSYGATIQATW